MWYPWAALSGSVHAYTHACIHACKHTAVLKGGGGGHAPRPPHVAAYVRCSEGGLGSEELATEEHDGSEGGLGSEELATEEHEGAELTRLDGRSEGASVEGLLREELERV